MKMTIKVEGCPYEDRDTLEIFSKSLEIYGSLIHAREKILSKLKYRDDLNHDEVDFLQEIWDDLHLDTLE